MTDDGIRSVKLPDVCAGCGEPVTIGNYTIGAQAFGPAWAFCSACDVKRHEARMAGIREKLKP
jgi:hypothetical protein